MNEKKREKKREKKIGQILDLSTKDPGRAIEELKKIAKKLGNTTNLLYGWKEVIQLASQARPEVVTQFVSNLLLEIFNLGFDCGQEELWII